MWPRTTAAAPRWGATVPHRSVQVPMKICDHPQCLVLECLELLLLLRGQDPRCKQLHPPLSSNTPLAQKRPTKRALAFFQAVVVRRKLIPKVRQLTLRPLQRNASVRRICADVSLNACGTHALMPARRTLPGRRQTQDGRARHGPVGNVCGGPRLSSLCPRYTLNSGATLWKWARTTWSKQHPLRKFTSCSCVW